jgi:hypothetical protein
MPATAKTGLGTTITFVTSSFTAKIIDIGNIFNVARGEIEASNMTSTDWMEYIPQDLADPGDLSFTIEYDGDVDPPVNAATEAINIDVAGGGTGYLVKGTGFVSGFTATAPHNDKMTADITVKWSGALDFAGTT